MKNALNEKLKSFVRIANDLDRDKKIRFMMLYGSSIDGRRNRLSDIDICVYYDDDKKNSFKFRKKLLGRLNSDFDVHIFQSLPLSVKKDLLRVKVLYSKDRRFLYDTAYKTIREFDDFKKYYYDYISKEGRNVKEENN